MNHVAQRAESTQIGTDPCEVDGDDGQPMQRLIPPAAFAAGTEAVPITAAEAATTARPAAILSRNADFRVLGLIIFAPPCVGGRSDFASFEDAPQAAVKIRSSGFDSSVLQGNLLRLRGWRQRLC